MQNKRIPQHQWTHTGNRVLLVKCVGKGGRGHDGFKWPRSGPVICPRAQADRETAAQPICESGGLFGWPWAINLGGGKEPDYRGDWIVFSAAPQDVIDLGDKCKSIGSCEVVYYGDALGALMHVHDGRVAWIEQHARGSASATGWRGSASATGERGSASATGDSGSASATGRNGSASATGESGSASATGHRGVAAITGGDGLIEIGQQALGAVTVNRWRWLVRRGAVVACRWQDADGNWPARLLSADELSLADGEIVIVENGQVQRQQQEIS